MSRNIAPSLLASDMRNLEATCSVVDSSVAWGYHLDVMDGVFVPNLSFGFPIFKAVRELAAKPVDVHLMIVSPDRYIERFATGGADYISVHIESCGRNLRKVLHHIREFGVKAGIAVNPETPVEAVIPYLHDADFILVMGVSPGFGGQKMVPESIEKVEVLSEMIATSGADCFIEFDGGVLESNIDALEKAGVDVIVAGSAVFGDSNPVEAIARLAD